MSGLHIANKYEHSDNVAGQPPCRAIRVVLGIA